MKYQHPILVILSLLLAIPAQAQIPDSISYQGYVEESGTPVENPSATLTFRLYDTPSGGAQIWGEVQTGVAISGGVFSVYLGSVARLDTLSFDRPLWLSTAIGNHLAPELEPRAPLTAAPYAFALRGIRVRPSTVYEYAPSLIGGYWKNTVTSGVNSATIGGGGDFFTPNHVGASAGTVGGGAGNTANGEYSTVGGGYSNVVIAGVGTISGGLLNDVVGQGGAIGGGINNRSGVYAAVGGGEKNRAEGGWSTVPGGFRNWAAADFSFAAGYNAKALHPYTFVFNGEQVDFDNFTDSLVSTGPGQFLIRAPGGVGVNTNAPSSPLTVSGVIESTTGGVKFPDGSVQTTASLGAAGWAITGNSGTTAGTNFLGTTDFEPLELRVNSERAIRLEPTDLGYEYGAVNVIGGASSNSVTAGVAGATISGGGSSETGEANKVYDHYGTIGGGFGNEAGASGGGESNAVAATISGGSWNIASAHGAVVGGGGYNTASGYRSLVGGGSQNQATDSVATVGGGKYNVASAKFSTISGGGGNSTSRGNLATDEWTTVGGGYDNQAGNNNGDETDAGYATVCGGRSNVSLGDRSTVGGGFANQANGPVSTVAGGWSNHADGERSFIGGGRDNRAGGYASMVPGGSGNYASGDYSFAAGRSARSYNEGCFTWADNSTTTNLECNNNNRWLARAAGGVYFYTNAGLTTGLYLSAGGSAWNVLSDRARKANFTRVDTGALLDRLASIEISSWNYTEQDPAIRHVGPTAQDFNSLLPFLGGEGETFINSLDADGVALAAIQGLYELVQKQQLEIERLKQRLNEGE